MRNSNVMKSLQFARNMLILLLRSITRELCWQLLARWGGCDREKDLDLGQTLCLWSDKIHWTSISNLLKSLVLCPGRVNLLCVTLSCVRGLSSDYPTLFLSFTGYTTQLKPYRTHRQATFVPRATLNHLPTQACSYYSSPNPYLQGMRYSLANFQFEYKWSYHWATLVVRVRFNWRCFAMPTSHYMLSELESTFYCCCCMPQTGKLHATH